MHPDTRTTKVYRYWTPEEDVKLISAITNTREKQWGNEYKPSWVAIAALVPGRTKSQCRTRWHDVLNPSIDWANGRTARSKWE
jgi:hypothetical protein